jgi:hypothetical protein
LAGHTLFFAKKSLTKPTGVLEHCREEETICWFSVPAVFRSDFILKAMYDFN